MATIVINMSNGLDPEDQADAVLSVANAVRQGRDFDYSSASVNWWVDRKGVQDFPREMFDLVLMLKVNQARCGDI